MTNYIKEYQGLYPEETRMDHLKSQISRLCPLKSCMLLSIPTQASSICGGAESAKANFSEFMSKFEDYSKRERDHQLLRLVTMKTAVATKPNQKVSAFGR